MRHWPNLALLLVLSALLMLGLTACAGDDDASPAPTHTATSAPTSTSTPVPSTATATPTQGHEHTEVEYGSDAPGSGAMNFHFDGEDHQHAEFDTCLGGEGDDCIGGIAIYSSDSPGYEPIEEDEPEDSLYVLEDGTTVGLEIVAIDEGFSLKHGEQNADAPGETLTLGTIPILEHDHVEYIIAVPGGTESFSKNVTLRIIDESGMYTDSETLTLNFRRAHE